MSTGTLQLNFDQLASSVLMLTIATRRLFWARWGWCQRRQSYPSGGMLAQGTCMACSAVLSLSLSLSLSTLPVLLQFLVSRDIVPLSNTFRHGHTGVSLEKWGSTYGRCYKSLFYKRTLLLCAYFLTTQTYKHMRLITQVYGSLVPRLSELGN